MKILWHHFEEKYSSFTSDEQKLINSELSKLYDVSYQVKQNHMPYAAYQALYFQDDHASEAIKEFLQSMFDCFRLWQRYQGISLVKELYQSIHK